MFFVFCALLPTGEAVLPYISSYAMYSYININRSYRSMVPGGHVRRMCESWKRQDRKERHAEDSPEINDRQKDEGEH